MSMVDAFDAIGLAPTLASSDFLRASGSTTATERLLVMNLSGAPRRYVTHIERIRAAFGSSWCP